MKHIKIDNPFCRVDYSMKIIWNNNTPQHKFSNFSTPIIGNLKIITKNIKYGKI